MFQKMNQLSEDAKLIREEVFVNEQGFEDEYDELDHIATHLVFYDGELPIATCRYYKEDLPGEYHIGRIAVRKSCRGKQIGRYMMETLEKLIGEEGGHKINVSAQMQAQGFYEKNGYVVVGEPYLEQECKHIDMTKILDFKPIVD